MDCIAISSSSETFQTRDGVVVFLTGSVQSLLLTKNPVQILTLKSNHNLSSVQREPFSFHTQLSSTHSDSSAFGPWTLRKVEACHSRRKVRLLQVPGPELESWCMVHHDTCATISGNPIMPLMKLSLEGEHLMYKKTFSSRLPGPAVTVAL